jgi:hypothetical protein
LHLLGDEWLGPGVANPLLLQLVYKTRFTNVSETYHSNCYLLLLLLLQELLSVLKKDCHDLDCWGVFLFFLILFIIIFFIIDILASVCNGDLIERFVILMPSLSIFFWD